MTENIKAEIEVINRLSKVARQRYGDNAVEALVGALSTVCTAKQLKALLNGWSSNV
jgi:hypothetical protein